jgi:hypothetical protein
LLQVALLTLKYVFRDELREQFLDAELQRITGDSDLGRRYADRLVKVYRLGGAEVWLLIHIEVQGRADARFQARMFQYYYRIYDRYGEMEILSLAVVTNERVGADLGVYRREGDGYGLRFRFRVRGLRDWREEELIARAVTNPFAVWRWRSERRTGGGAIRDARPGNGKSSSCCTAIGTSVRMY